MLNALRSVHSLLLAIFILMAGGGFMNTLVSMRLEQAGVSALQIGLVGTAYFSGLIVGALRAPGLVRRVGHIRAFATFVAVLSASTLAYALHRDTLVWGALRLIDGMCLAGIYVCLESWLNERAQPQVRGVILASYMMALYGGQALGQFLLNLGPTGSALPMIAGSILLSLATIPVVLTRITVPEPSDTVALPFRTLYAVSPLGIVGACLTGVMLGAFYAMGAVYARRLGLDVAGAALFMSIVILGGVLLQWPLGRLSDLFDRREVIVASFGGAALASLAIALADTPGALLLSLGALFGGLGFALYPLCVAHTNDHLEPPERVAASSGIVMFYSAGAAIGPTAAGMAMSFLGTEGLFLFIAAGAGAGFTFGIWRQVRSVAVPAHLQETFIALPRTTPVAAALDPLGAQSEDESRSNS